MGLKKLGLATAVMFATSSMAFAADDLQINGFINVTAGVMDTKSTSAVGYDTTLGFDQNTLAGLQLSKKVNSDTSATVQLMSRGSQGYKTEAAWAFITYELSDNTDIRMGRLRTPFFQYSDFLEVGYAYNWITPPTLVYRLDSMSSLTGVDMTHRFTLGAVDGSIQLYTGRYSDDFNLYGEVYKMELNSAAGAVLNMNAGDFGTRLSYHQAEFYINDIDSSGSGSRNLDQLVGLGMSMGLNPNDFIPQGQTSQFLQGSLFWDNGSTSLVGEYTALRHDSNLLNDDHAWFVSAAQRLGDFTAHLTYAESDDDLKSGTIGTVQKFTEKKDSSITLGVRYDYNSSTAFKVETRYLTSESADDRLAAAAARTPGAENLPLVKSTGTLYTVGMTIVF